LYLETSTAKSKTGEIFAAKPRHNPQKTGYLLQETGYLVITSNQTVAYRILGNLDRARASMHQKHGSAILKESIIHSYPPVNHGNKCD
jgi:hypothetical protein